MEIALRSRVHRSGIRPIEGESAQASFAPTVRADFASDHEGDAYR
jgi:hypothetical protein